MKNELQSVVLMFLVQMLQDFVCLKKETVFMLSKICFPIAYFHIPVDIMYEKEEANP